jgi:transposase
MGFRHAISDADWDRAEGLLPGQPGPHGGVAEDNRRFLDAVRRIARTGAPWRDLPARLGRWNSPWGRFDRWATAGRLAALAATLRAPDPDVLPLDATAIRAHPSAAGARRNGAGPGAGTSRPSAEAGAGSGRRSTAASTASATRGGCSCRRPTSRTSPGPRPCWPTAGRGW